MAWPDNLSTIKSNMNASELWVLKEQMEAGNYEMKNIQAFAEYCGWDLHINGEVYKFSEYLESIASVQRQ